jgi:hypothetical protein
MDENGKLDSNMEKCLMELRKWGFATGEEVGCWSWDDAWGIRAPNEMHGRWLDNKAELQYPRNKAWLRSLH